MAKHLFAGVTSSAQRITITPAPIETKASTLALDQIIDRSSGDSRPLTPSHVTNLAESIAAVGLIQPIAVDNQGRLLAGGHRRAAIEELKESNPDVFKKHFSEGIPVRRYEFDAAENVELALAIEATENEKRRDYTPAEVRELASRLKEAGYHYTPGRAKAGQKSFLPSLSVIVGKSERTVQRYLSEEGSSLNTTDVVFRKQLEQSIRSLRKLQDIKPSSPKERQLLKDIPEMIDRLEQTYSTSL
jgi:ParB family transcriptional regulator, chromosome partitioning protein